MIQAVPLDDTKPLTFEDGQSTKTVSGVGVYAINSGWIYTLRLTNSTLALQIQVTVKRVDKNDAEVTATYTPTVTKVTPTSTDATQMVSKVNRKGTPTTEANPLVPIDDTKPILSEDSHSTKNNSSRCR